MPSQRTGSRSLQLRLPFVFIDLIVLSVFRPSKDYLTSYFFKTVCVAVRHDSCLKAALGSAPSRGVPASSVPKSSVRQYFPPRFRRKRRLSASFFLLRLLSKHSTQFWTGQTHDAGRLSAGRRSLS